MSVEAPWENDPVVTETTPKGITTNPDAPWESDQIAVNPAAPWEADAIHAAPPKRLDKPDADYPVATVAAIRSPLELARMDDANLSVFKNNTIETLTRIEKEGKYTTKTLNGVPMDPELSGYDNLHPEARRAFMQRDSVLAALGKRDAVDVNEFGPMTQAYRVKDGRPEFDPYRTRKGIEQATADSVITKEQADEYLKEVPTAEKLVEQRMKILDDAGANSEQKALLLGAGRGGVMLATATGAAQLGAKVPGPTQLKAATAFVAGVGGALASGAAMTKAQEALAPHFELMKTLEASGKLHPELTAGGEIAAFATGIPASLGKLAAGARMVAEQEGKLAATGFVAKQVGGAAAAGLGADALIQGGMIATGNQEEYSLPSAATTTALAALLAGKGVKFREVDNAGVGNILRRGLAGEPLDRADVEIFNAARNGMVDVANSTGIPENLTQTAKQLLSFRRPLTVVETRVQRASTKLAADDPYAGVASAGASPVAPAGPATPTSTTAATRQQSSAPVSAQPGETQTVVFGARGVQLPAEYRWGNTQEIQTSHAGEMMGANPRYPLANSRDYSQPEEIAKQLDTRNNFDPRRHVTDAPDASVGPRTVATVIDEAGTPIETTLGGNNRGWAIANLPADTRAQLNALQNAKAGNFGLPQNDDPNAEIVRHVGEFDLRQQGERERLQGIVDVLNPAPGMVQGSGKRAELDAVNVPPDQLAGMGMDVAPRDAQDFVRGLIAQGVVDRNLTGALAENPSQAQDYTQRVLAHAAFKTPLLVEARMNPNGAGTTERGMLDAAVPALVRMRALGAEGVAMADAVSRTFANAFQVRGTLPVALETAARQTEFDPASQVAQSIAEGLRDSLVMDAKGRPLPEPSAANAATLFSFIERAVTNFNPEPDLFGNAETPGEVVMRAVQHFRERGISAAADGGGKPRGKAPTRPVIETAPKTLQGETALKAEDFSEDTALAFQDKNGNWVNVPMVHLAGMKPVESPELMQLVKDLGASLGVKKMKSARGQFIGGGKGAVWLNYKIFQDPVLAGKVLAHELWHLADYLPTETLKRGNLWGRIWSLLNYRKELWTSGGPTNKQMREQLIKLTQAVKPFDENLDPKYTAYRYSAVELYADFGSVLMWNAGLAKQIAPDFYRQFWNGLQTKPEVKQALYDLQQWLAKPWADRQGDRIRNIKVGYKDGAERFVALQEEAKTRKLAGFRRGFVDQMKQWTIDEFTPAVSRATEAGTPLGEEIVAMLDAHPWGENMHWQTLANIDDRVTQYAGRAGWTPQDIGLELQMQRIANEDLAVSEKMTEQYGIEKGGRKHLANPGMHNPDTAKAVLLKTRMEGVEIAKRLGLQGAELANALRRHRQRIAALETAVSNLRQVHHDVMREAFDSEWISPEAWELVRKNGYYAAFVPLEYVDTYAPASIGKQLGTVSPIANPFLHTVLKLVAFQHASAANRVRLKLRDLMKESFPDEIRPAPVRKLKDGHEEFVSSGEAGWGMLELRENGKRMAYEVPDDLAIMFQRDNSTLAAFREMPLNWMSRNFRKWLYPMYITFNPYFQLVTNPVRDVLQVVKAKAQGQSIAGALRQLPLVKHIGRNPALQAARDLVYRRGLTKEGEAARMAAAQAGGEANFLALQKAEADLDKAIQTRNAYEQAQAQARIDSIQREIARVNPAQVQAAELQIEKLRANDEIIRRGKDELQAALAAGDSARARTAEAMMLKAQQEGTYVNTLAAEMLDTWAIMPGEQTFYSSAKATGDAAMDALMARFHLLPEAAAKSALPAILKGPVTSGLIAGVGGLALGGLPTAIHAAAAVGLRDVVKQVGAVNELLPKIAAYQNLAAIEGVMRGPESELSVHVRNNTGTPNFKKGGKNISMLGGITPFIRVWIAGWRASMQAAGISGASLKKSFPYIQPGPGFGKKTLPNGEPNPLRISRSGWWMRWFLFGGGIATVLKVAQEVGLFGEDAKNALDGVSEHDKANKDILTLGHTGASDANPSGKTAAIMLPRTPEDRLMSNVFYQILRRGARALADNGTLGPKVQQMNAGKPMPPNALSTAALASIDADIPGITPLLVAPMKVWSMETGGEPRDDFRNSDILSNAASDARKNTMWPARAEMVTWIAKQSGAQSFLRYNPSADTWQEAVITGVPGMGSWLKVTDAGHRELQREIGTDEAAARGEVATYVTNDTRQLAIEYGSLLKLGAKVRTPAQEERYQTLKVWHSNFYKQGLEAIQNAETSADKFEHKNTLHQQSQQYLRKK